MTTRVLLATFTHKGEKGNGPVMPIMWGALIQIGDVLRGAAVNALR
jgi:hypothetical protein